MSVSHLLNQVPYLHRASHTGLPLLSFALPHSHCDVPSYYIIFAPLSVHPRLVYGVFFFSFVFFYNRSPRIEL
jgi:hypothetical protein